jgi:DNA-binding GntR family transcriptional regulator
MLSPVDKSSLSVEVAKKIRIDIFNGRILPGQKLLEQELSEQMNTSRGPVREAFIRLEHEGLVTREPNRSVTVVDMTAEDVEEVHSLRLNLELLALRYICAGRPAADIGPLEKTVEKLRKSIAAGADLADAVEIDLEFHEEMVRASGHGRLYKLWLSIKPQIGFLIFTKNIHSIFDFESGADQHEELISAIAARDYPRSERVLRGHLTNVLNALLKSFDSEAGD